MIRTFWGMTFLLLLSIAAVAGHYHAVDTKKIERERSSVASLVRFVEPSLSVSWYERRTLHLAYRSIRNPVYPEMQGMERMDFVYGE